MIKLLKKTYNVFKSIFTNNYALKKQFLELEDRFLKMERTNLNILQHLIVAVASTNLENSHKEMKKLGEKASSIGNSYNHHHQTKKHKDTTNILRILQLHVQDKNPTYH